MSDIKKVSSTRQQVALSYIRAVEVDDKDALARLLSENYSRVMIPHANADKHIRRKAHALGSRVLPEQFIEKKGTPLDVMETVDGRVVMQLRWMGLRNDGSWVKKEEMRIISFEDRGPFDNPLVREVKIFVDWVGAVQWLSPHAASRVTLQAHYNSINGLDQGNSVSPNPGSDGKCSIM